MPARHDRRRLFGCFFVFLHEIKRQMGEYKHNKGNASDDDHRPRKPTSWWGYSSCRKNHQRDAANIIKY